MKLFLRDYSLIKQKRGKKANHPLYGIWKGMRNRCTNPKNKAYPGYGGRGISVCEAWDDFDQFCQDMGDRPSPTHSIDRIDNDKGYSPDNCRWATPAEQCVNKRLRKDANLDSWWRKVHTSH